jgi:hypothetical protein
VTATPRRTSIDLSFFLNLCASDIKRFYEHWRSREATFIKEPKVHASELRCYNPHLINMKTEGT